MNKNEKAIYWQTFLKVSTILINLTVGVAVINYLGPEQQGKLSYSINLSSLLSFLVFLGFSAYISQSIVNKKINLNNLFSSVIIIRLIGTLVLTSICIYIYIVTDRTSDIMIIALVCISYLFISLNIFQEMYEGYGYMELAGKANFLVLIVVAIVRTVILYLDLGLMFIAVTYPMEQLTNAVFAYFIMRNKADTFKFDFSVQFSKNLFLKTFPLALTAVVYGVYTQIDVLVIGFFLGDHDVGVYSAAMRTVTPFYFVSGVIISIAFSKFSKLYYTDKQSFYLFFQILSGIFFVLAITIIVFMNFFGEYIFSILFTPEFISSYSSAVILIYAMPFVYLGPLSLKLIILNEEFNIELYKTSFAAVFNIISSSLTVPRFGVEAAAFCTVISYSISNFWFYLFFSSYRKYFLLIILSIPKMYRNWSLFRGSI